MYLKVHAVSPKLRTLEGMPRITGHPCTHASSELRKKPLMRTQVTRANKGLGRRARTMSEQAAQAQQYKDRNRPPRERRRTEAGLVPWEPSSHALGAPSLHNSAHTPAQRAQDWPHSSHRKAGAPSSEGV